MTIYTNVNEFCSAVMAHKGADPSMISVEARKPRSPSPTNGTRWAARHIHPPPPPTEFKVGTWGQGEQRKRLIKSIMVEKGVYLLSLWGGEDKVSGARKNAMDSIRVGDTLRMPDYKDGIEYVGHVETLPISLTRKTLASEYQDVWKVAWGNEGPDERDIHFRVLKVSWGCTPLTPETEKDLKKLVKNGGKCTRQCGTIIKLI